MQRNVEIEWDLESTPLAVITNSVLGSGDQARVRFYSAGEEFVGTVWLYFTTTLQYSLYHCNVYTNLPVTPPSATDKVWRITLTRTAGVRVVIHCNDVEVLNRLLSGATCINSLWSTIWNRDVTKIQFESSDTASDYYRAGD